MDKTIESLTTNPYFNIAGFIIGFLGVLLTIVFYLRAKKEKIPCFEISSNTILEKLHKSLDGLEVHYKGEAQERITITKVAFWNDGKETIDRNHLVEKDSLRLICPLSAKILDIRIVKSSAESNFVQIDNPVSDKDVTYYPLNFEYLDNKDSFIIQIVHTGNSHECFDIKGKIKGVNEIKRIVLDSKLFDLIDETDVHMGRLHSVFIELVGTLFIVYLLLTDEKYRTTPIYVLLSAGLLFIIGRLQGLKKHIPRSPL